MLYTQKSKIQKQKKHRSYCGNLKLGPDTYGYADRDPWEAEGAVRTA